MTLRFSTQPGRRERHLRRRHQNPLFGNPAPDTTRKELERARSADRQEAAEFERHFTKLVQQAAGLQPNEDSEVILKLKAELDQAYEQVSGLSGEWAAQKQAIGQLTGLIMAAVRRGAGSDPQALDELQQEEAARAMHYGLLACPLVADLLHQDATIPPQELAPSLLSCDAEELQVALQLFDDGQLSQIEEEASGLLQDLPQQAVPPSAVERLAKIRQWQRNGDPLEIH